MSGQVEIQINTPAPKDGQKYQTPQIDERNPKFKSDIDKAGFLSALNFSFVLPLTFRVWRKSRKNQELNEQDLLTFPYSKRAENLEKEYMQRLQKQQSKKKINTAWAVLGAIKWQVLSTLFIQIFFCFLRIFQGYLIKRLIECYLNPELASTDAYWWAAILAGVLAVAFYADHHWNDGTSRFGAYAKAGIISMLYSKITRLSTHSITQLSAGQLINLAANDVNTVEMLSFFFPSVISGWACIFAGAALLWIDFGVVCLLGVGYIIATVPTQMIIAKTASKPRAEKNVITDERVRKTSELIQDIRLLKMYTWELKFREIIADLRKKDISANNKALFWESLSRAVANSSHFIAAFLIFMLYYVTGGNLTISKVFAGYYILNYMRIFGGYFVYNSFTFVAEAKLFFQRLDKIMEASEMDEVVFDAPLDSSNSIEFDKFTAYWTKDKSSSASQNTLVTETAPINTPQNNKPTLVNINLNIKKNSLNAMVGTVGSGKTSFLLSFTGEMPQTIGSLRYKGSIAYVEQEPIIFAGTFRESILFGKPFNEEFYHRIIKACNLESDLALFPLGDMSMIGERGNNLSGGQKARLALARAVYADTDIYLLDDPLSAVDAKVAKSIYNETILGLLANKTVILVTHQVHFVKEAENIIVMNGGTVQGSGNFEELKAQGVDVNTIFSLHKNQNSEEENEGEQREGEKNHHTNQISKPQPTPREANKTSDHQKQNAKDEEAVIVPLDKDPYAGEVNLKAYRLLLREIGYGMAFLMFLLCLVAQFGDIAFGRVLGAWTAGDFNLGTSLGVLGGLALYLIIIQLIRNMSLTYGFFGAARRYHDKMLDKIIKSPVSFFDTNPVGRILNRFANDIGVLDKFFPQISLDVFDMLFPVISISITLAIVDPILLGPIVGSLTLIVLIVIFYYPTLKQTKSFDLQTRGPLFSLYSSTISGIVVIRTFGQTEFIKRKFAAMLHTNTKGNLNFFLSSRLLGFCVDLFYTLSGIGMIYIITARIDSSDPNSGAIAGFCLALILSLTGSFQHGVRQTCQANVLMAATSRAQAYCNLPSEAPITVPQDQELKNKQWPTKGEIQFNKVWMKYRPDTEFVLKDLDLLVSSGEKIGCVGRTGAGKSTIINLLFRLQEIDRSGDRAKDSFIKIDETNTLPLGLHLLRGNISIIPQTPFMFTGTIRQNLDPLGQYSDAQIWNALEEVRLKEHVEKLGDKLSTTVNNASSVFSVGQKQLVCLARTLLRPCKVLVLDEATANMDTEIDDFIQKKIMEKFKSATVFTIAHRLSTIANYDKVLVLDKGRRIEFDEPYKLLAKNIGDETLTNTTGHFASMVMNTGPKTTQRIVNIARETYNKKHNIQ